MAHSSFGSGWPNCDYSNIRTIIRPVDGLRVAAHVELVPLVALLIDLTEMHGLDVLPGQTWGNACRPIRGTQRPSNHSWGTAIDINAPSNPMASADWHRRNANATVLGRRLHTQFTDEIVNMWKAAGFGWGGEYVNRPDPMHFEFKGSVQDARNNYRKLVDFLNASTPTPAPLPIPVPVPRPEIPTIPKPPTPTTPEVYDMRLRTLKQGMEGGDVGTLQSLLNGKASQNLRVDRDFGPSTHSAVVRLQQFFKLTPDGIVGPKTWGVLSL